MGTWVNFLTQEVARLTVLVEGEGIGGGIGYYWLDRGSLIDCGIRDGESVQVADFDTGFNLFLGRFEGGGVLGEGERWIMPLIRVMCREELATLRAGMMMGRVCRIGWQGRYEAYDRVGRHMEAYRSRKLGMGLQEFRLRVQLGIWDLCGFGRGLRGILGGECVEPGSEVEAAAAGREAYYAVKVEDEEGGLEGELRLAVMNLLILEGVPMEVVERFYASSGSEHELKG